jgi:tRNA U34 5-carboxymethylaminomethyl modifying GTPase MnmE/TrmE
MTVKAEADDAASSLITAQKKINRLKSKYSVLCNYADAEETHLTQELDLVQSDLKELKDLCDDLTNEVSSHAEHRSDGRQDRRLTWTLCLV